MVHATLCLATGEELEDHHGWLQDAPKGHLNAFRGRRDEAPEDQTYNQDEFDPGESFMAKAKGLSQLALQRAKLLNDGRHVEQKLKRSTPKSCASSTGRVTSSQSLPALLHQVRRH